MLKWMTSIHSLNTDLNEPNDRVEKFPTLEAAKAAAQQIEDNLNTKDRFHG